MLAGVVDPPNMDVQSNTEEPIMEGTKRPRKCWQSPAYKARRTEGRQFQSPSITEHEPDAAGMWEHEDSDAPETPRGMLISDAGDGTSKP